MIHIEKNKISDQCFWDTLHNVLWRFKQKGNHATYLIMKQLNFTTVHDELV